MSYKKLKIRDKTLQELNQRVGDHENHNSSNHPNESNRDFKQHHEDHPPPPPFLMMSTCDQSSSECVETLLRDNLICCFVIGGERRLCLPQILNTVLKDYSLAEINSVCDELQIYCSRCSVSQLDLLKKREIIPRSAPSCGLITKTDAERLVSSLVDKSVPPNHPVMSSDQISSNNNLLRQNGDKNRKDLNSSKTNHHSKHDDEDQMKSGDIKLITNLKVYHDCFGKCSGVFRSKLYSHSSASCIECSECSGLFTPEKFVCHTHKPRNNRICHWGFDSLNWRSYLLLSEEYSRVDQKKREELECLLDNLKSKFLLININSAPSYVKSPSSSSSSLSSDKPLMPHDPLFLLSSISHKTVQQLISGVNNNHEYHSHHQNSGPSLSSPSLTPLNLNKHHSDAVRMTIVSSPQKREHNNDNPDHQPMSSSSAGGSSHSKRFKSSSSSSSPIMNVHNNNLNDNNPPQPASSSSSGKSSLMSATQKHKTDYHNSHDAPADHHQNKQNTVNKHNNHDNHIKTSSGSKHQMITSPRVSMTPPPPFLMMSTCDQSSSECVETLLRDNLICCFVIGGERRLCLPQILNTVLKDYSLAEINSVCDELQIYCSRCSVSQLDLLKKREIIPRSAPSCGLITKTDAERLVSSLVDGRNYSPPSESVNQSLKSLVAEMNHRKNLLSEAAKKKVNGTVNGHLKPSKDDKSSKGDEDPLDIKVYHQCFGKCSGVFRSKLYSHSSASCIECSECSGLFTPEKFVCHTHKPRNNRICHWGFDSLNWRSYLLLSEEYSRVDQKKREELECLLDNLKSKFLLININSAPSYVKSPSSSSSSLSSENHPLMPHDPLSLLSSIYHKSVQQLLHGTSSSSSTPGVNNMPSHLYPPLPFPLYPLHPFSLYPIHPSPLHIPFRKSHEMTHHQKNDYCCNSLNQEL